MKNSPIIIQAFEEHTFKAMQVWKQSLWIISGGVFLFLWIFWNMHQPELTTFCIAIVLLIVLAGNLLALFNQNWTIRHARTLVIESNKIQSLSEKGENFEWDAAKLSFKGKSKFIGNQELAKKSPKSFFLLGTDDWQSVKDL